MAGLQGVEGAVKAGAIEAGVAALPAFRRCIDDP
jgi:hypothetical protein